MAIPRIGLLPALCALLALCLGPALHGAERSKNELGINLWFHRDFNNSLAFADLVKRSRAWGSVASPGTPITLVDGHGWPRQDAGLFLHVSLQDAPDGSIVDGPCPLPAGTYRVIFSGRANRIAPSTGRIENQLFDPLTNTTRADWVLDQPAFNNVFMTFEGTRRAPGLPLNSGLKNLRIFLPGYPEDGSVVFRSEFKALVGRFSVVRFMDWMDTNTNDLARFGSRTRLGDATQARLHAISDRPAPGMQTTSGVAFEHMIQLCNETGTDMWINVPALASNSCIRSMLTLLRDGNPGAGVPPLGPERKLYVEFANEIWNPSAGFLSFRRVRRQASLARQDPLHPINFDGSTNTADREFLGFFRFVAFRAKRLSDLCREVFGEAAMMSRVRPVLASQFGDGQASFSIGLRFLSEYYGRVRPGNPVARPVQDILYGGGGAPYAFGPDTSVEAFFGAFPQPEFVPSARIDATLAAAYGIRCLAYEGGPAIADPVNGASDLDSVTRRAINADARMKGALQGAHEQWVGAGGELLTYYVATGDPSFEMTPTETMASTPKLAAIDALAAVPKAAVSAGQLVPAAFAAGGAPDAIEEGSFPESAGSTVRVLRARTFLGRAQLILPFHTADSLPAAVSVAVEVAGGPEGGEVEVLVNNVPLGAPLVVAANAPAALVTAGSCTTREGLNALRILARKGEVRVGTVSVSPP